MLLEENNIATSGLKLNRKEGDKVFFAPRNERGQGLLEYALIIILVVVIVLVIFVLLGPAVRNMYNTVVINV